MKAVGQAGRRVMLRARNAGDIQHVAAHAQRRQRHAVLRQRAGFVHAQHAGGTQSFDGVQAPRQHLIGRQAARAQGQEDDHDHRELLRHHAHGQRDAGQQRLQPVAAQTEKKQRQRQAEAQPHHHQQAHQPADLVAQR